MSSHDKNKCSSNHSCTNRGETREQELSRNVILVLDQNGIRYTKKNKLVSTVVTCFKQMKEARDKRIKGDPFFSK